MQTENDKGNSARCLVETWTQRARKALECGENTDDPMGKRLVEHGGVIYANCVRELEQFFNAEAHRWFDEADGCEEGQ